MKRRHPDKPDRERRPRRSWRDEEHRRPEWRPREHERAPFRSERGEEFPPWPPWDHDHVPPWMDEKHRAHFHEWHEKSKRKRNLLFLRFATIFGVIVLLILGGMLALAFLLNSLFGGTTQTAWIVWLGGCGLSLALPLLAAAVATRAFRSIAAPLADVMTAADAVADGDLSVRVPVRGHGPFARLNRSFNRMTEELEQADQRRRNLTADVAHELRTPLHVIQGNLEGILDDVYQPTEEHISATLEETRTLARLVEDLRTLSLAEAGQLPMVREPVDVQELLADVSTTFSGQAEVAGVTLQVEMPGDGSIMNVIGDAGRLDQVLSNLVANALRYTPSGGSITLRAESVDGGVRLVVQDTGAGIPPEDLPFIFDRFWRADRSRSHARGANTGLGLAIARQLVQAQGGFIGVESQVGQGTTFHINLPAGA